MNRTNLASKGRYGDTMLAHINPREAAILKVLGGAGTRNPRTGLPEFFTDDFLYFGNATDEDKTNIGNLWTKANQYSTVPGYGFDTYLPELKTGWESGKYSRAGTENALNTVIAQGQSYVPPTTPPPGDTSEGFFDPPATTSDIQQLPVWNEEQQALFKQLAGLASTPQPVYSGDLYSPENPYERQYFDYVSQVPGNLDAIRQALMESFKPAYDINPQASKDYWEKTLLPEYQDTWENTTLPQFNESFSGPQWWSSNRANQLTDLVGNYGKFLSGEEAELLYKDELARREALENAMNRTVQGASTAGNLVTQGSNILSQAGQAQRTIDQEKIAGQLQKWLMGGQDPSGQTNAISNPNVSLAMSLLGFSPFAYQTTSTSTGGGLGYNIVAGAAPAIGGAVSNLGQQFLNWLATQT